MKNLKPWLIELNASPSLNGSNQKDYKMKFQMLNEVTEILNLGLFLDVSIVIWI